MTEFFDWLTGNPDTVVPVFIALAAVVFVMLVAINVSRQRARKRAAEKDEKRSHLRDM